MSFRSWVYVFAIIGLNAYVGSGQAQEEAQTHHRQTDGQQYETDNPAAGSGIDMVADQAAANASQSREEESRQREIADLAAQQGMNAATQSMNIATQRMADYSFWSTVMVGIGTGLLLYTLWLTRQANKAAQEGVNVTRTMMQEQIRAYIAVAEVEGGGARCSFHYISEVFSVEINFKNVGSTPASSVVFNGICAIKIGGEVIGWSKHIDIHGGMAPKGSASIAWEISDFNRQRFESAPTVKLIMTGRFHYLTRHGQYANTGISIEGEAAYGIIRRGWAYSAQGNDLS